MITNAIFLIPFLLFSILNIIYVRKNNRLGIFVTKPLLMPLLMLFYLLNASVINYSILAALAFGFLGDVFLLQDVNQRRILAGIASFLTGHIFYISTFVGDYYNTLDIPVWSLLFLLPYIGGALLLLKKLFSSIQFIKLPVIVYMSVILLMSFSSILRVWTVSLLSFLLTFAGSLSFILSDSLLAFDLFTVRLKKSDTAVMTTYILAQLLIVLGLL